MHCLEEEIATFRKLEPELRPGRSGCWVVICGHELGGVYPDFQKAAREAVARYGAREFLLRQIDAPELELPLAALAGA